MPTSQPGQIPTIVSLLQASYGKRFLEIGPGFGKWGFLIREYIDAQDGREKFKREDWLCTVDAIEVFPDYLSPIHAYVYNTVHVGDALEVVPKLAPHYDVALLIDVLEHFTKENGTTLVRELQKRCDAVLISVPKDIGEQGAAFGNVFETHRHLWTKGDLLSFTWDPRPVIGKHDIPTAVPMMTVPDRRSLIAYIGRNAPRVRNRLRFAALQQRSPRLASLVARLMNRGR